VLTDLILRRKDTPEESHKEERKNSIFRTPEGWNFEIDRNHWLLEGENHRFSRQLCSSVQGSKGIGDNCS
jgi:hypothetical protein